MPGFAGVAVEHVPQPVMISEHFLQFPLESETKLLALHLVQIVPVPDVFRAQALQSVPQAKQVLELVFKNPELHALHVTGVVAVAATQVLQPGMIEEHESQVPSGLGVKALDEQAVQILPGPAGFFSTQALQFFPHFAQAPLVVL